MNPINLKELKTGDKVDGLLYIQSHGAKTAGSKAPVYGQAYYHGKTMGFKIWDPNFQEIFSSHDLAGQIIHVNGDVGTYREKTEITLMGINFNSGVTDTSLFFKSVDVDKIFNEFGVFVNTNLSQNGVKVLSTIFSTENLYEPFKVTWAGARMHDAQVGGLMNHTMKMLRLAEVLMTNDARLQPWKDLMYLSIILHDIGKVNELSDGTYTENSFVTHRTMGVEIVAKYKNEISELFGETFYYHILAVITGHHGEYGDKPTTIWAYIIHLIDNLEASVTGFLDAWDNGNVNTKNGQQTVWVHGDNLVV